MRFIKILVIFSIFLLSCSPKAEVSREKPDKLLSKGDMIQLLMDVQLIEAARSKNYLSVKDSLKEIKEAYALVFAKYEITQQDFEDNLLYYYDFSGQMEEMLGESLNELTKMEAELNSKEEE